MSEQVTIERVKGVIRTSLKLPESADLADQMPLIGGEYDLDSLDILLIVTSMEKEFGIEIPDKKVGREVFATVATLTAFVQGHRAGGGG